MVVIQSIRRWWLEKTTKVVVMTTGIWDGGSIEEYAICKRSYQFPLFFNKEYLDLSINNFAEPSGRGSQNWNKNQGSMYQIPKGVIKPLAVQWWTQPEHVLKYCTSSDLDKVVKAKKALFDFIKPTPQKLPKATEIVDVNFELAQFKLRGGAKEKD